MRILVLVESSYSLVPIWLSLIIYFFCRDTCSNGKSMIIIKLDTHFSYVHWFKINSIKINLTQVTKVLNLFGDVGLCRENVLTSYMTAKSQAKICLRLYYNPSHVPTKEWYTNCVCHYICKETRARIHKKKQIYEQNHNTLSLLSFEPLLESEFETLQVTTDGLS